MEQNNEQNKKNKTLLFIIVLVATVILITVGSTFAYFSTEAASAENAISMRSAIFRLELEDDTDLIKSNVIPSEERYVDIAAKRTDANGFIKPYDDGEGNIIKDRTACIDDNLNEICSIYTFTIKNPMTDNEVPLYITLNPSVNNFENLYFKVLDDNLDEVISKTHLVDDREYTLDGEDNKIYTPGSNISPIVLTECNVTLPKATDSTHPSSVTYSIVLWIDETFQNQNASDSGKVFAATLNASASNGNGTGITGVISAAGTDG